jgi:3-phenylpropionate/trans-cinnamate dioxygenase ferredoxin subunit
MAKLVKITDTASLPPGKAASFNVEGTQIALFNVGGTYYAIDDTCPHSGGPLSEGQVEGTKVTCPWHAADFDLKTGAVLSPPAFEGVRAYKVVVAGNDIQIEVG